MLSKKIFVFRPEEHPIDTVFIKELRKIGIDINLFVPKGKRITKTEYIKEYHWFGMSDFPIPLFLSNKWDIIETSEIFSPITFVCFLLSKLFRKNQIVCCEKFTYSRKVKLRRVVQLLLKTYGAKIAGSRNVALYSRSHAAKSFIYDSLNIKTPVISPMVNIEAPIGNKKCEPIEKLKILVISRHIPHRDLKGLIISIADFPNISCTFIGDGPMKENHQKLAKVLKIKAKFINKVNHREIPRIMSKHSIFFLPSFFDTIGLAAYESISTGLPVICTNVGGLKEIHPLGFTCASSDEVWDSLIKYGVALIKPGDYSIALTALHENSSLLSTTRKKAQELAISKFSPKALISKYLHLYNA